MDVFDSYKAGQRARWASFAPLEAVTTIPAAHLVKHAGIVPRQRVLDVACGTGVVAVTAARRGALVTGLDLTPELLEVARANGAIAGVNVDWHEGDVEKLPFPNASFDVVVSQFGHMFAPRPDVAIAEMLRVLAPGGTIAFSTWPPELYTGAMFILIGRYSPPLPPGIAPPPLWGDPQVVRERLGAAVRDLVFDRRTALVPVLSAAHHRERTEKSAGPLIKLIEELSASDPAKLVRFRGEFEALTERFLDDNTLRQDFLMTRATKL